MNWQMKRDMSLVRQILLEMENHPHLPGYPIDLNIEGYSKELVSYHVNIMGEAGLIEAEPEVATGRPPLWRPTKITWEGQDFLDAARNEKIWLKAVKEVGKVGGSITFVVFKELLTQYVKEQLGLG